MNKYILDKMLLYNISTSRRKKFSLNIKRVGFTEYGIFADLTVFIKEVKIEGILGLTYKGKKEIKNIVELQELIPDIDMELTCNEELELRCNVIANKFKKLRQLDFIDNNPKEIENY